MLKRIHIQNALNKINSKGRKKGGIDEISNQISFKDRVERLVNRTLDPEYDFMKNKLKLNTVELSK